MTISQKRKRKIVVDDVEYLWWVTEDLDAYYYGAPEDRTGQGYGNALNIVSVDGQRSWHLFLPLLVRTQEGSRQIHEIGPRLVASIIRRYQAGANLGWDEIDEPEP